MVTCPGALGASAPVEVVGVGPAVVAVDATPAGCVVVVELVDVVEPQLVSTPIAIGAASASDAARNRFTSTLVGTEGRLGGRAPGDYCRWTPADWNSAGGRGQKSSPD